VFSWSSRLHRRLDRREGSQRPAVSYTRFLFFFTATSYRLELHQSDLLNPLGKLAGRAVCFADGFFSVFLIIDFLDPVSQNLVD